MKAACALTRPSLTAIAVARSQRKVTVASSAEPTVSRTDPSSKRICQVVSGLVSSTVCSSTRWTPRLAAASPTSSRSARWAASNQAGERYSGTTPRLRRDGGDGTCPHEPNCFDKHHQVSRPHFGSPLMLRPGATPLCCPTMSKRAESRPGDLNVKLMRVARAHRTMAASLLSQVGLHPGQEALLMELWDHDGRTQADLAESLGVEPPTVTKMLQRMENADLVDRRPDADRPAGHPRPPHPEGSSAQGQGREAVGRARGPNPRGSVRSPAELAALVVELPRGQPHRAERHVGPSPGAHTASVQSAPNRGAGPRDDDSLEGTAWASSTRSRNRRTPSPAA